MVLCPHRLPHAPQPHGVPSMAGIRGRRQPSGQSLHFKELKQNKRGKFIKVEKRLSMFDTDSSV